MIVGKLIVIRTGSAVAVIAAITTTSTQFGGMLRFASVIQYVDRSIIQPKERRHSLLPVFSQNPDISLLTLVMP
jgi:hypothetical protein